MFERNQLSRLLRSYLQHVARPPHAVRPVWAERAKRESSDTAAARAPRVCGAGLCGRCGHGCGMLGLNFNLEQKVGTNLSYIPCIV